MVAYTQQVTSLCKASKVARIRETVSASACTLKISTVQWVEGVSWFAIKDFLLSSAAAFRKEFAWSIIWRLMPWLCQLLLLFSDFPLGVLRSMSVSDILSAESSSGFWNDFGAHRGKKKGKKLKDIRASLELQKLDRGYPS
jgi:hypothetical protein